MLQLPINNVKLNNSWTKVGDTWKLDLILMSLMTWNNTLYGIKDI